MIPLYQMLSVSPEMLKDRAESLAQAAQQSGWKVEVIPTKDTFGGGSAPERTIDGWGVRIMPPPSPEDLARLAREFDPPIVGTVSEDSYLLSIRCMFPHDYPDLVRFLRSGLAQS